MSLSELAAKADLYYTKRQERLDLQKKVDDLEKAEKELKAELIDALRSQDATGVGGQLCRVTLVVKQVPQAVDWDEVWKYITRRKAYDLVQRRLSETAVRERWNDHVEIPGIVAFPVSDLSINKVK